MGVCVSADVSALTLEQQLSTGLSTLPKLFCEALTDHTTSSKILCSCVVNVTPAKDKTLTFFGLDTVKERVYQKVLSVKNLNDIVRKRCEYLPCDRKK